MDKAKSGATARTTGPIADAPNVQLPIVLLAADVKAKARAAFLRGKLQAQVVQYGCDYTGPCAIGIALTKKQRIYLDDVLSNMSIEDLLAKGTVETDNPDYLMSVQKAHDNRAFRRLRTLLGIEGAA